MRAPRRRGTNARVSLLRRHPLALLLLLAAALRAAVTWGASAHHPDEIFQYLEQAHRLVFGYGYVPWEYRAGMRSWLVPALLAAPMWLGDALAPDTLAYLILPRLLVALATLGIVWGAWSLGERTSRRHALIAAFVAAIWFEQVYYASHTLTETIAVATAIPGVALLQRERRRDLILAGALLAFAALVRFHYAPALALLVVWRCRLDARAWRDVILGALPILAVSALVDLAAGMRPYGWIATNFRRNVIENASATYGVSGPLYYLAELSKAWGLAFMPIVFLAIFGARRHPQLLAAAVLTILIHMTIGHKEPRFILLATTLIVFLAAIGTADLIALATPARHAPLTALALTGWSIASLSLALAGDMRLQWSNEAPALSAASLAGRDPKLCGFATYGMRYWQTGGHTFLHRDTPIYPLSARDELGIPAIDAATLARIAPGFNAIVTTPQGIPDIPKNYTLVTCRIPPRAFSNAAEQGARAICLYRRPGGCDPLVASAWRLR